jgi:hypothetical protein
MANEVATMCANCGKAEQLEVKLKTCLACKLVKYCGRDCQIAQLITQEGVQKASSRIT